MCICTAISGCWLRSHAEECTNVRRYRQVPQRLLRPQGDARIGQHAPEGRRRLSKPISFSFHYWIPSLQFNSIPPEIVSFCYFHLMMFPVDCRARVARQSMFWRYSKNLVLFHSFIDIDSFIPSFKYLLSPIRLLHLCLWLVSSLCK